MSTSILSRTVDDIQKDESKNFIAVGKAIIQKRIEKKKKLHTGIVLLSHIPPDFNEYAMKGYMKQFGDVLNLRLERSLKTGRSKGYAFIKFRYASVAKIVVETMNNYVLGNRLLKAQFKSRMADPHFWERPNGIRIEKYETEKEKIAKKISQRKAVRKVRGNSDGIGEEKRISKRQKSKKKLLEKDEEKVRNRLFKLEEMMERLKAKGINYSYKPAIEKPIRDSQSTILDSSSTVTGGKYVCLVSPAKLNTSANKNTKSAKAETPVLEIDESDKEIEFATPPNVMKRKLSTSKALNQKSALKKLNTSKQGNVKAKKGQGRRKVMSTNGANETPERVDTSVRKQTSVTPDVQTRYSGKKKFSQKLKKSGVKTQQ